LNISFIQEQIHWSNQITYCQKL